MSCATIQPLKEPEVSLLGIEPIKSKGMAPRFVLHLSVSNPNAQDLAIEGMTFSLAIDEQEVLSGLANNIPTLIAYGETNVDVEAKINLFDLFKLLANLSKSNNKDLSYNLSTTIDPEGFIAITVEHEGKLDDALLEGLKKGR